MGADTIRFQNLISNIHIGKVNIVTGNNGTGKSRFFGMATTNIIETIKLSAGSFQQVICLSGTHNDKYPRNVWQASQDETAICYLGYKVANNMISDIAPFRVIVSEMLAAQLSQRTKPTALKFCLEQLSISSEIKLHFRYGKNKKSGISEFVSNEVSLDLFSMQVGFDVHAVKAAIDEKSLSLQTISVKRGDEFFSLSDLSSGERAYMVALLGALYCARAKSLIFFDEPENSLHPGWQKSILRDLRQVLALQNLETTILVATHSPLIAGSIQNQDAVTCNFPSGQNWQLSDLFGKTSDTTLKDQFNIFSSRSAVVVRLTQKCLNYIAKGDLVSPDLHTSIEQLLAMSLDPEPGDPMRNILKTLSFVRDHHDLPRSTA
ncbi:AAA family ATPase [Pseudomonas chlororaphis]|uniref:AAA family ATPase n=1 Tax=Pseudomonas chlororaphis TaxID=587753 RepID=UPI001B3056D5|nr:AAA family ATPase [Pseudomonas chlororaphis]QTT89810.1 ATP-binding protein [Pseudomonas chlororaphis]